MAKRKTKKQRYADQLNKIATRYSRMEDQTIRKILALFKALRKDIADSVVHVEGYEAFRLKALQGHINRLIDQFERDLKHEMDGALEFAVADGRDSVLEPLKELAATLPQQLQDLIKTRPVQKPYTPAVAVMGGAFLGPVPATANIAVDFSAELIKNIVEPMRAEINAVLRLAILGRVKPIDAMRRVTKILGVQARVGVWAKRKPIVSGVAARAETDVRTEMQRMYNISHYSQMKMLDQIMPGLLKRWIATGDMRTRTSHLRIHRETARNPIPIGEPFILIPAKGPNKDKKMKLMYPGDPEGPPELTINCRCKMAIIHPDIGVIGSSLDGRIGAELKRRGITISDNGKEG